MTDNIYLIGFMAAGKTTVAQALHEMTGYRLIDTDAQIVEMTGRIIPDIFREDGEGGFRRIETECLREVSAGHEQIISCGGGVAIQAVNQQIMRMHGTCVLLEASAATILARVADDDSRPLLEGRKTISGIQSLMDERLPFYTAAANIRISVDAKTPQQIAEEIVVRLGIPA